MQAWLVKERQSAVAPDEVPQSDSGWMFLKFIWKASTFTAGMVYLILSLMALAEMFSYVLALKFHKLLLEPPFQLCERGEGGSSHLHTLMFCYDETHWHLGWTLFTFFLQVKGTFTSI